MEKRRIKIFDTTLRDGEQAPGCSMNTGEKLKIAKQLEHMRVDVIEAGFAASSPGDFEAVKRIADSVKGSTVCSLARANKKDVDAAWGAIKGAADPLLHVFIATSDLHMAVKLRMEREQVLSRIREAVTYARALCPKVEFSAEDASRSDREFLRLAIIAALESGASVINIPDTVGYTTPSEMFELVSWLRANIPELEGASLSTHCHDDLGMAVANSLAAVEAGATQVECAINGIGERAGNCSLEEIVMAIRTRGDRLGAYTGVDSTRLTRASRTLSRIIGISVPPNKAIVGRNAFAHEAGIHQHGVLANPLTYEIMTPESVGCRKNSMVLGKHSGKHAFEERLAELGYIVDKDELTAAFKEFKVICDRKKEITDDDLQAIMDVLTHTPEVFKLARFVVNSGNSIDSTTVVTLIKEDDGEITDVALGEGPIDAAYNAINRIAKMDMSLDDYKLRAVSGGEDALGEVSARVSWQGKKVTGRGISTDILEASIKAYIHALNKLLALG